MIGPSYLLAVYGAQELRRLVEQHDLEVVDVYMGHALGHGEVAVREAIDKLHDGSFAYEIGQRSKDCRARQY